LSNHIMGQRLLPKVQRIAQLSSSVSDRHGAMLKPRRSEQDDSPMSKFEKHFVRKKCKFPSGFCFSCSSSKHVHNCGVKIEFGKFFFFFFKKFEVFRIDTCGEAHLPSENQEITELDRSLSVCGVEW
jgi:hypothetical protein